MAISQNWKILHEGFQQMGKVNHDSQQQMPKHTNPSISVETQH